MSRQSLPLDPLRVASLELGDEPLVAGGPLAPTDFCTVGVFFLLREAEIAAARYEHLAFSDRCPSSHGAGGSASLLLPSSKTDPRAVGITRTWDCCCSAGSLSTICPVHALRRQAARLSALASELGVDVGPLPLFPGSDGREVGKAAAVATITAVAQMYGVAIRNAKGANLFGGHSLRTGGAAFLASRGVNPFKIQALGRWRSPLVIHYAGAAMATGLARDLSIFESAGSLGAAPSGSSGAAGSVSTFLPEVIDPPEVVAPSGLFATNPVSLIVHWVPSHSSGKTRCGWGGVEATNTCSNVPVNAQWHQICDRCLPQLRESMLNTEMGLFDFSEDEA